MPRLKNALSIVRAKPKRETICRFSPSENRAVATAGFETDDAGNPLVPGGVQGGLVDHVGLEPTTNRL